MKQVTISLYSFDELNEDAKQKAIEKLYNINVDLDWWESTYEDAVNIGLKIKEFDIDRASFVRGEFINSANFTANAIMKEHGKDCETYKTASTFIQAGEDIVTNAKEQGKDGDEEYWFEDEIEEIEEEFLKSLCEDYRIILQKEYEYLTGKEAIIETIQANEYNFTSDGILSNL